MKRIILTLMMVLGAVMVLSATNYYDFEDYNFYFRVLGGNNVALTHGGTYEDPETHLGTYSGWYLPVIPSTVTYRGRTYTVTAIDDNAFAWSNYMEYVEIPNTVETIGFQSFNGCNGLERAVIPSSVKRIASAAYSFCYDLTEVTIGSSLEKIGPSAFGWCNRLNKVVCEAIIPPVLDDDDTSVMYGDCFSSYSKATLRVPRESLHKYMAAEIWSKFSKIISIEDELGIGDVDNDGKLSIKDVTSLIDDLLEGNDSSVYADVDGDGNVSIKDVTALIDQLLSGAQ